MVITGDKQYVRRVATAIIIVISLGYHRYHRYHHGLGYHHYHRYQWQQTICQTEVAITLIIAILVVITPSKTQCEKNVFE
jgi:succinate dehydrogenase hydrophobic anchor subunit